MAGNIYDPIASGPRGLYTSGGIVPMNYTGNNTYTSLDNTLKYQYNTFKQPSTASTATNDSWFGKGGWFDQNAAGLAGIGQLAQGIGGILNFYNGLQANRLAKKQMALAAQSAQDNFNAQAKILNGRVDSGISTASALAGLTDAETKKLREEGEAHKIGLVNYHV